MLARGFAAVCSAQVSDHCLVTLAGRNNAARSHSVREHWGRVR